MQARREFKEIIKVKGKHRPTTRLLYTGRPSFKTEEETESFPEEKKVKNSL